MSQYIVWFLLWLCLCLMPISYKKAKFGITEVKSNFSNFPEFFRRQRFVSVNGFILFPIASGVIWAVALGGWAIFQDFTYARWTGSVLGFISTSIIFLFLGAVTRYICVINIRGREPIDIADHIEYIGIRPLVAIIAVLLLSASNVTPLMGNLDFNPMFKDLNESENNTDAPTNYLTDPNEVRVISWYLATQYLERSYGDSASSLNANEWEMMDYTTQS